MATEIKQNRQHNDWKNVIKIFVSDMLVHMNDNISRSIHDWFKRTKRKSIALLLIAVGFIFFLIGVARVINVWLTREFQWAGYLIVGIIMLAIGYLISNKKD